MRSSTTHAQESVFNELIFSIPYALMYVHLTIGFHQQRNYLELLLETDYLMGLAFRSFWAFSLLLLIKFITCYLDRKRPWLSSKWSRLFIQIFYCLLSVVIVDFFVSTLYFDRKEMPISDQTYIHVQLIPVCIYITLINLYYNLPGFIGEKENVVDSEIARYAKAQDVVYISISNKIHYAKNILGEPVIWNHTLTESIAALPANEFYKVDRSCIVRRDAITVTIEAKKRRVIVLLKLPVKIEIKIADANVPAFIEWWMENEERKSFQSPHGVSEC